MIGTKAQVLEYIETLPNDATKYTFDRYFEKRSKDMNSYFHVLCDKLRQKLGVSMDCMKNKLVADYGQIMYLPNGDQATFKSNVPPEFMQELAEPHTSFITSETENGKEVYFYRLYHKTRNYDSRAMHKLIEGTIADCKDQGIETATPEELARLEALWKQKHG